MRLAEFARVLPLIILSALLAFSLSACGGQEEVAEPVTSEGVEDQQATEIDSGYFDVNTVNIVPIERADIDLAEYMDENRETINQSEDLLEDIMAHGGIGRNIVGSTIMQRVVLTKSSDEWLLEEGLVHLEGFRADEGVSYAMFTANRAEEGLATIADLFITPEEREAFDQTVIQVIRDAEENGTGNIYRLLGQVLETEESNSFISLTAAMHTGYLMAKDYDLHSGIIGLVADHMEHLSNQALSR